jgi:hypothetical protein
MERVDTFVQATETDPAKFAPNVMCARFCDFHGFDEYLELPEPATYGDLCRAVRVGGLPYPTFCFFHLGHELESPCLLRISELASSDCIAVVSIGFFPQKSFPKIDGAFYSLDSRYSEWFQDLWISSYDFRYPYDHGMFSNLASPLSRESAHGQELLGLLDRWLEGPEQPVHGRNLADYMAFAENLFDPWAILGDSGDAAGEDIEDGFYPPEPELSDEEQPEFAPGYLGIAEDLRMSMRLS